MHGQPRRRSPRPEDAAAAAAKAAALRDLQSQLLSNHKNKIYTKEALATSSKLLDMNPDTYTAWNYRKLAVPHNLHGREQDLEAVKSAVDDELRLVEMALMRNPKAYGAWYHRKWVLNMGICSVDFDREFRLLDKLLKVDARNFHGWNYRRFLAKLKNVAEEDELKFTKKMIDTNFSNYSAWHNRSVVLSRLLREKANGFDAKDNILTEEYELVSDALFTDPNDQSGWFYHMWLLDQTIHLAGVRLVSSWPSNGSNLFLTTTNKAYGLEMVTSIGLNAYFVSNTRKFPIILYFSDSVKDVNTSTIKVCAPFVNNEDLLWRPLSVGKVEKARCWMTLVDVPDTKCNSSSTHEIVVSFGQSNETKTSDSFLYYSPSQFTFTATINYDKLEETEDEYTEDMFLRNSDNLCCPQENTDSTLEELNISEDLFPEGSKWSIQTLLNEINRFKELLDDDDSKFVKLTLARLLVAPDAMNSCKTLLKQKKERTNVVLNLYSELILLDPPHR